MEKVNHDVIITRHLLGIEMKQKISDTGNRTRGDNVKDCRVTDYTISDSRLIIN